MAVLESSSTSSILDHASVDPQRACLSSSGLRWSYARLVADMVLLKQRVESKPAGPIGIDCREGYAFISAILGMHAAGRDVILLPNEMQRSAARQFAAQLGAVTCVSDDEACDDAVMSWMPQHDVERTAIVDASLAYDDAVTGGRVFVPTSGTTGQPKAAIHRWESLTATVHTGPVFAKARWLLTYSPARFASLQVILQSILSGAYLVIPTSREPAQLSQTIIDERITHISGTPTFWRLLLAGTDRACRERWPLQQIALGGEVVTPGMLATLRGEFPNTRICHIYASTEMGVCLSANDGVAGFPISRLDSNEGDVRLKVEAGQLYVRSQRAMERYASGQVSTTDGWFATGDLAEVRGDRFYVLGRRDELINVGGDKVWPLQVEERICAVPGVQAARVFGQRSAITGSIVRAQVVAQPGEDVNELRRRIFEHCRAVLPAFKVPRLIDFVSEIAATAAGKTARVQVTA